MKERLATFCLWGFSTHMPGAKGPLFFGKAFTIVLPSMASQTNGRLTDNLPCLAKEATSRLGCRLFSV